jgi:hypothetical protein
LYILLSIFFLICNKNRHTFNYTNMSIVHVPIQLACIFRDTRMSLELAIYHTHMHIVGRSYNVRVQSSTADPLTSLSSPLSFSFSFTRTHGRPTRTGRRSPGQPLANSGAAARHRGFATLSPFYSSTLHSPSPRRPCRPRSRPPRRYCFTACSRPLPADSDAGEVGFLLTSA